MATRGKKPSATDRTVDMFAALGPVEERPIEVLEEAQHEGERVPLEQDVDRMRQSAFTVQDWTTKAFGDPEVGGNQFRVSFKKPHYYVEMLRGEPGKQAYGYAGFMVHESDLLPLVEVMVRAVREKQKSDAQST